MMAAALDQDAIVAAAHLVERSGARSFEVGWDCCWSAAFGVVRGLDAAAFPEIATTVREDDAEWIAFFDPPTVRKIVDDLRVTRLLRDQLSRDATDARRQLGIARASVVRLDDERRILRDLLGDLTAKATPHGPEIDEPGGPYVGAYLLPVGPVHRALAYLRDGAVPVKHEPEGAA